MSDRQARMRSTRDLIRHLNVLLAKIDAITEKLKRKRLRSQTTRRRRRKS
jgi:hypothetical protein